MNIKSIKRGASHCLNQFLTMCTLSCLFGLNADKLYRQLRLRMDHVKRNLKSAMEEECRLYRDIFICQFDLEALHAKFEDCQINLQYLVEDLSSVRNRRWKRKFQKEVYKTWNILLKHQQPIQNHRDKYREIYFQGFETQYDSGMSSCASSVTSINELPCSSQAAHQEYTYEEPTSHPLFNTTENDGNAPVTYFSKPGANDDGADEYAELWDERANELLDFLGI